MELFAIAAVAHHHQVPWQSFKYITDDANENSGDDWQGKVNHGQELYLKMLAQILSS
jgi:adenosylhomocysteine nucleosidase